MTLLTTVLTFFGFGSSTAEVATAVIDANQAALDHQPLCAPHLGVGQFLTQPEAPKHSRHHSSNHRQPPPKATARPAPSHNQGARQSRPPNKAPAKKPWRTTVCPALPEMARRIQAFHQLRKKTGLTHACTLPEEWHIGGKRLAYTEEVVAKFEANMRALQCRHSCIEGLAKRLATIGIAGLTYLEGGFRLRTGGHTYGYTDDGITAARQEVEGHIHRHTLPARNRQRVEGLNARIHALTTGTWLPQPMLSLELTDTHIVYQGTEVPLGDEVGINRVFATLEPKLSAQEETCRIVAALQTLTERTMAALQRFIALQPKNSDQKWMTVNTMLFHKDGFTATLNGRLTNLAYTRANLARLENELIRFEAELSAAEAAKATTPAVTAKPKGGSTPLSAALSSALRPST